MLLPCCATPSVAIWEEIATLRVRHEVASRPPESLGSSMPRDYAPANEGPGRALQAVFACTPKPFGQDLHTAAQPPDHWPHQLARSKNGDALHAVHPCRLAGAGVSWCSGGMQQLSTAAAHIDRWRALQQPANLASPPLRSVRTQQGPITEVGHLPSVCCIQLLLTASRVCRR